MKLILIGEENSKRTDFFKKAAENFHVPVEVIGWDVLQQEGFSLRNLQQAAVKIDPPSFQTIRLSHMQSLLEIYKKALQKLTQADCHFLNSPEAIWCLLDKKGTKGHLHKMHIPVTQMFEDEIGDSEQLLGQMHSRHCYSVFVKPRYFSGAAGVAAFRAHPFRGDMVLYTSCRIENGDLVNTKKLFKMTNRDEIVTFLNRLLALDCVIERWHPKAGYKGKSYDLRVVFQFGHIAHIVVRQSNGPITNLHLNNQALEVKELGLDSRCIQGIEEVCFQAVSSFSGLHMAGVDILLEKETMRPMVIEMNGQGDLIYQDIYDKNNIYREQVEKLCRI